MMANANVDDKIEKLWELLELHIKDYERRIKRMRELIKRRDVVSFGNLAGEVVVIGQSDVCYATSIEILDDLK